jgi:hypothetical protein
MKKTVALVLFLLFCISVSAQAVEVAGFNGWFPRKDTGPVENLSKPFSAPFDFTGPGYLTLRIYVDPVRLLGNIWFGLAFIYDGSKNPTGEMRFGKLIRGVTIQNGRIIKGDPAEGSPAYFEIVHKMEEPKRFKGIVQLTSIHYCGGMGCYQLGPQYVKLSMEVTSSLPPERMPNYKTPPVPPNIADSKKIPGTPNPIPSTGVKVAPPSPPSSSAPPAEGVADRTGGLIGEWRIHSGGLLGSPQENKSNFQATLIISKTGSGFSGKLKFDVFNVWENLPDVFFQNGRLKFTRPPLMGRKHNQYYELQVSNNEMRGIFKDILQATGQYSDYRTWGNKVK